MLGIERCPECGDEVWGFVQPRREQLPAHPDGVPSWYATVFPCEHGAWFPVPVPPPPGVTQVGYDSVP